MVINIKKNTRLTINIYKKGNKYLFSIGVRDQYFNYNTTLKVKREKLLALVDKMEGNLFSRKLTCDAISIQNVSFILYYNNDERMRLLFKIGVLQEHAVSLNRSQLIDFYGYLIMSLDLMHKGELISLKRKYTYVYVRYLDVCNYNRYCYICDDKTVEVGDIVYVDRAGVRCWAVVTDKREYYFNDAPYPVLETKRVLKIVMRARTYRI